MRRRLGGMMALVFAFALSLNTVSAADDIVIHGLVSQGFLKTTDNNYLNESKDGSSEFNEYILNFQKNMDDKLRVGVQLISRDLGKEGNNNVKVDWGYGDYRVNDNFGVRLGRVKVPFGMYNQYRDIDMLRTPVLLPTLIYMEDYRTFLTAFNGGSLYGSIPLKKGSIDLEMVVGGADIDPDAGVVKEVVGNLNRKFEAGATAKLYAGLAANPKTALLVPVVKAQGAKVAHVGDPERDTSSRICNSSKIVWNTPVEGLKIGGTHSDVDTQTHELMIFQPVIAKAPVNLTTFMPAFTTQVESNLRFKVDIGSFEYNINKFTFAGEYMAAHQTLSYTFTTTPEIASTTSGQVSATSVGTYLQAVYRHNDRHEWALCRSELFSDKNNKISTESHKDTSASFRYNITGDWSVKLEYHWFDGTGQLQYEMNPQGVERKWNMVAFKTSYNF